MKLGLHSWRTFDEGLQKEYLITNGLGSSCSSTIIGANIRKYNGLLNASLVAPVKRVLLLAKIDEEITIGEKTYPLHSNEFIGKRTEGFKHLRNVSYDLLPRFSFGIQDVCIEKEISMEYGKNTVAIVYRVNTGKEKIKMSFTPYVNFRDHHDLSKREGFHYTQHYEGNTLHLVEKETNLDLKIISNCTYLQKESWSLPVFYRNEAERELKPIDFHFIPGEFTYEMEPYGEYIITFSATIETDTDINPLSIISEEKKRRQKLLELAGYQEPILKELTLAADQFIVERFSTGKKTVIAGYPWFTDWGRDTMIAFSGLTLVTKRFQEAKEILLTFIEYLKFGLIPNMFPDENNQPMYNTADGTLWFFQAVYKYLEYTGDRETVKKEIYPYLKEIIQYHIKGTEYDIFMDEDALLSAGNDGTQLTWMDVKVGDWVVTPRHGKAVEINALWYNALKIMDKFSAEFEEADIMYGTLAEKVKNSFVEQFWNEDEKCLYDVIQGGQKIGKLRPNQVIAVSLPYCMLDKEKSRLVVQKVYQSLYTPYGLRSLSTEDHEYIGIYKGDIYHRDGAYHQGTVWGWLIGPFLDAYGKVNEYSQESKNRIKQMLNEFYMHMQDGCLGSIAEIFDGDEPFYPRGCMAQAWSVAEVIRVYVELL